MDRVFLLGLLGAWLNRNELGFRQKDVRFYIELINDWLASGSDFKNIKIQNTQVMRFLDNLHSRDWLVKQNGPVYFFKNKHFILLMKEAFSIDHEGSLEIFLLQFHLASVYRDTINNLLFRRGVELSHGEKIDLDILLSPKIMAQKKSEFLRIQIKSIESRISEVKEMVHFSKVQLKDKKPLEVVYELEKINPYKLQYYQSMGQTFKDLIPEIVERELTEHSSNRIATLWLPLKKKLESHLAIIEAL